MTEGFEKVRYGVSKVFSYALGSFSTLLRGKAGTSCRLLQLTGISEPIWIKKSGEIATHWKLARVSKILQYRYRTCQVFFLFGSSVTSKRVIQPFWQYPFHLYHLFCCTLRVTGPLAAEDRLVFISKSLIMRQKGWNFLNTVHCFRSKLSIIPGHLKHKNCF